MQHEEPRIDRLIALVAAAALVLNYPILYLFGDALLLLGIPMLYLYLFSAWLIIIALAGAIMSGRLREKNDGRSGPGP